MFDTLSCTLIGCVLATVLYFVDYRQVSRLSTWVFGLLLVSLVMATLRADLRMVVGASPYILAVLSGILLHKHKGRDPLDLAVTCAVVGVPALLLLSVPSFSSAAAYLVVSFSILTSLRVNKKQFAAISLTVILVLLIIVTATHPYIWVRIQSSLNPQSDPQGAGWLSISLTEAVQQGGAFGQRLEAAPAFPEPQTVYVFIYLIYRYGWVTGLTVSILAALLILRLVHVCRSVREPVGRTVAIGVTTTFAMYFSANMLMALGKAPFLSLSFPFISYSRLLLVVEIAAVGLVLGIYRIKDMIIFNPEVITNDQQA